MSIFRDDFYSTKTSKWKQDRKVRRSRARRNHPLFLMVGSAVLGGLLVFLSIVLLSSPEKQSGPEAPATHGLLASYDDLVVTAIDKVAPAVVSIISSDNMLNTERYDLVGMGSGIIFGKQGDRARIVTNHHVVEDGTRIEVMLADGEVREAAVLGKDRLTDLAVLEIDAEGIETVAVFGNSDDLRTGEMAIAIGNPLGGLSQTVTAGIISRPKRDIPVSISLDGVPDWEIEMIQTDAAINQGNSGGALISLKGEVIGINSLKVADMGVEGLGFALPINEVKPILEMLIADRKVKRPFIGVSTQELQSFVSGLEGLQLPDEVSKGLIVMEASGPAKEAGMKTSDVIVALDDRPISSVLELRKYLYNEKQIGDKMEITFYRSGKLSTVHILLVENDEG